MASTTRKIWCGFTCTFTARSSAGGVEDDDVAAVLFGEVDGVAADLHGVFVVALGIDGHVGLLAEGVQLVDGGGALQVGGDEEGIFAFGFQVEGELAAGGGFAGALEAAHHEDGGAGGDEHDAWGGTGEAHAAARCFAAGLGDVGVGAHEADEFVVDDFDHLLARLDGGEHDGADGLFGDFCDELVDDVVVDVGFEEGGAHLFHGVADVGFGDFSLAGEVAEEGAEFILERVEHSL
jgi:hypothetical protein